MTEPPSRAGAGFAGSGAKAAIRVETQETLPQSGQPISSPIAGNSYSWRHSTHRTCSFSTPI
ncbi:MAG TPA: hypothetical protein VFB25_10605 [Gaiellaceae bacterium]|nr:hypothetical protein [Gaiellaceae bacterium]